MARSNKWGRLERLEQQAAEVDPERPAGVPEAWAAFGPDGVAVGPEPGDRVSRGQRRSFEELLEMDASVPAVPPPGWQPPVAAYDPWAPAEATGGGGSDDNHEQPQEAAGSKPWDAIEKS